MGGFVDPGDEDHMEIWAFCEACSRWFYCPDWFDRSQPPPRCPVCQTEPTAMENRAATSPGAAAFPSSP